MFAKVLKIVGKWYGNPTSKDVFPQILEDAVYAWKTGEFEGVHVFQAEDPGTEGEMPQQSRGRSSPRKRKTLTQNQERNRQRRSEMLGARGYGSICRALVASNSTGFVPRWRHLSVIP